jgi:hypothetical protein
LNHPWITRKLNEKLPLTREEKHQLEARNYAIEEKLRKAISLLIFFSI